ncbi:MAG: hypothetical protein NDJ90_06705 [Oligoflexia bacterium]|nr:hypothetical protein [Oligoflexia bacterium]
MSLSGDKNRKTLLLLAALIGLPALLFLVRFGLKSPESKKAEPQTETPSEAVTEIAKPETQKEIAPAPITVPKEGESRKTVPAVPTTPGAPLPTTPGLPPSQAKVPAPVVTEAAPPQGCVTLVFHHKKQTGHTDEEACSQHKNLIKLPHANPTSLCVRVNKTPVRFQQIAGKPNEILVAAIAGPRSEITARYCFGKATCQEDCTIPKDEFMDAIGGSDSDKLAGAGQWDNGAKEADVNAHLDAEMKRELDNLDRHVRGDNGVFNGWLSGAPAAACGTKPVLVKGAD